MSTDTVFAFATQPDERRLRVALAQFYRPQFGFARGVGLFLIVLGALLMYWDEPSAGVAPVVAGLALGLFFPRVTVRRAAKQIGGLVDRPAGFHIDEQGIRVGTDLIDSLYRWPGITRVDELPGMLLARLGKAGFVAVPTTGLPPETVAALTGFVRARVGRG